MLSSLIFEVHCRGNRQIANVSETDQMTEFHIVPHFNFGVF